MSERERRVQCSAHCHPERARFSRGLCQRCYCAARKTGTLADHPRRGVGQAEFVADYETLRGEGLIRIEIASRLGMSRDAVDVAYIRAVRAGLLTPDPAHMRIEACDRAVEKGRAARGTHA